MLNIRPADDYVEYVSLIGNLFEQITCFRHYSTVQPCYPEEKTDIKDLY